MKRIVVALIMLAVAFVLASQAFPQALRLLSPVVRIPYMAETEFLRYADDGKTICEHSYSVSYSRNGAEIILSTTFPGHPIQTAIRRVLDAARFLTQPVPHTSGVGSCVVSPNSVLGTEVILNHRAVALDLHPANDNERLTAWLAPDLGCFALKMQRGRRRADGSYMLESQRRTLKVETGF